MKTINTEILTGRDGIRRAARILAGGGLVAFPTETVYGLGASAFDPAAVARIFEAKGRPADNPLIVHLAGLEDAAGLTGPLPPPLAERVRLLAARFWPGPLTMVLPRSPRVPDCVAAGLDTVAVRVPNHPAALALIRESGLPVAAPSANLSGRPSPTRAEHVLEDLSGRVDAVFDGGPTGIGVESTVLDLTSPVPAILRPGGVTRAELAPLLGEVRGGTSGDFSESGSPDGGFHGPARSPGMKYLHYAPRAPLHLYEGPAAAVRREMLREARLAAEAGRRVGVLVPSEWVPEFSSVPGTQVLSAGREGDLTALAAGLYDRLRQFDQAGTDLVLGAGVGFDASGLGAAVADRFRRAAGGRIHRIGTGAKPGLEAKPAPGSTGAGNAEG